MKSLYIYFIYIKCVWIYILHLKKKTTPTQMGGAAVSCKEWILQFYSALWMCSKSLDLCSQSLWFPSKNMRDIFHCDLSIILHMLEKGNSNKALIRKHWHKTSSVFIYLSTVIQQQSQWGPYITLPQRLERLRRRYAPRHVFFVQLFQDCVCSYENL